MLSIARSLQNLCDLINPFFPYWETAEIKQHRACLDFLLRDYANKCRAEKRKPLAEVLGDETTPIDRIMQNSIHADTWSNYFTALQNPLQSTPNNFMRYYATQCPSAVTSANFFTVSGHFNLGSFITYANVTTQAIIKLNNVCERLKKEHPDLEDALDNEVGILSRFRAKTLMVNDLYLNSLDIPAHIKQLYPTSETITFTGKVMQGLGYAYYQLLDRLNRLTSRYGYEINFSPIGPTVIPLLVGSLFMLIPHSIELAIGKVYNTLLHNIPGWVPSPEFSTSPLEEPFWVYFRYHPEKDTAVDFGNLDFNPCNDINQSYFPRRMFIQKVTEMHDSMVQGIEYYRTHHIPLQNEEIMEARYSLLTRVAEIDKLVVLSQSTLN